MEPIDRRWMRRVCMTLSLLVALLAIPVSAQEDDSDKSLSELREEKANIDADLLANARSVNAEVATISEVNTALVVLREATASARGEIAAFAQLIASAEQSLRAADERVAEAEANVSEMETVLKEQAVLAFVRAEEGPDQLLRSGDPTLAIRRETLDADVFGSRDDAVNDLVGAVGELAVDQADAAAAADQVRSLTEESRQALKNLQRDTLTFEGVVADSEARLDHLLSEKQSLIRLDSSISTELSAAEAELAKLLAASPGRGGSGGNVVDRTQIVDASGIEVHTSIAGAVRALLAAARADGVNLAGGGYRDSADQVAARRANCGTSNYAIYEMPSSRCRPPTAPPGSSMHERGLAIDFTYNGSVIRRRSGPAWEWLSANAADYGLYNLPSEPWHWSVNAR